MHDMQSRAGDDSPGDAGDVHRELLERLQRARDGVGSLAVVEVEASRVMEAYAGTGPLGEPYLTAMFLRVSVRASSGRHAEAVQEFGEMIDTALPVFGPDNPRMLWWRLGCAVNLTYLNRLEEAEAECSTVLARSRKLWPMPKRYELRLSAMTQTAGVMNSRGMYAEGERRVRSALRAVRPGEVSHRVLRSSHFVLGGSLNGQQKYREAERVLKRVRPADQFARLSMHLGLGAARLGLGRLAEAEADAREAVAISGFGIGPSHYQIVRAGTLLGSVLAAQGRADEAKRQLEASVAAWEEHFGADHPRAIAAREELARIGGEAG
jgi:tetratricopeptide (TPR) repeat protein